jgi:hypothetical protein
MDYCVVLGQFCTTKHWGTAGVDMEHSISSTSCITDTSTYIQLSLQPKTTMAYRGHGGNLSYMWHSEAGCETMWTGRHTNILTEHAAGMGNMIHGNAGTCLPDFTVSHRTRLYLALTTMRTSYLTTWLQKLNTNISHVMIITLLLCLQLLKSKLWFTIQLKYCIKLKHSLTFWQRSFIFKF